MEGAPVPELECAGFFGERIICCVAKTIYGRRNEVRSDSLQMRTWGAPFGASVSAYWATFAVALLVTSPSANGLSFEVWPSTPRVAPFSLRPSVEVPLILERVVYREGEQPAGYASEAVVDQLAASLRGSGIFSTVVDSVRSGELSSEKIKASVIVSTTIDRKPLRSLAVSLLAAVSYFASLAFVEQHFEAWGVMECSFDFPDGGRVAYSVRRRALLRSGGLSQGPEDEIIAIRYLLLGALTDAMLTELATKLGERGDR